MPKSKVKIEVKNLYKSFADKKVLEGIDLKIHEGECFVLIGGSGSGKSVLIKNIAMLLQPNSGSILLDGQELTKNKEIQKDYLSKIGYLFQNGALFDSLTIWENICFKLLKSNMSRVAIKNKAIDALKDVGLDSNVADLFPAELSGGMLKRAALARAVVLKPEIIFFDEPTTGLDPVMAEVIDDLITRYAKQLGATTITITHDMATVSKISDQIAMLHRGKIAWQGNLKELSKTKNKIVQSYFARKF